MTVIPFIVLVAVAVVWLARQPGQPQTIHTTPPTTVAPVVTAAELSSVIAQPTAIAVTDGHVWVTGYAPGNGPATLLDFDTATRNLIGRVSLADNSPFAMAANSSGLWLRTQQGEESTSLLKVDPRTHTVVLTIPLSLDGGLAVTDSDVWTIDGSRLLDTDPATGAAKATVPLPSAYGPLFVTAGPLGVWLTNPYDNTVWKVDTQTSTANVFTTLTARAGPIVQTDTNLWVNTGEQLIGLDPNDPNARSNIDLPGVQDLTTSGNTLLATTGRNAYRIDATDLTPAPLTTLPADAGALFVAADDHTGTPWVTTLHPPAIQPAG